ncbi:MAG: DUF4091 domain-containing protein [Candidatus Sumerlaeota bacterium]|nr:DUF4091 domain-containing protein [Candidatus Sumerlaeota bacterium]
MTISQWLLMWWMAALGCFAQAACAAGLLSNGGFEEMRRSELLGGLDPKTRAFYDGTGESAFQDWVFGGRWEGGSYSNSVSGEARSGLRSCQITCQRKGRGGIGSVPLKFKAGASIQVSVWVKAAEANGGRVFLNLEGTPGDGWSHKELKTGTYDWTKFTHRAVVPEGKTGAEQTIVFFLYSTCEGSIWVDDFEVETVDVSAAGGGNTPGEGSAAGVAAGDSAARPKFAKPIAEPKDSIGYRVNVVSAMEKVFREDDYAATISAAVVIASARNEYESAQIVIEAPWRAVTVEDVRMPELRGPGGAVIAANALKWDRVEYIQTTQEPAYFTERGLGWYPDPLMPAGAFTVEKLSRTPVWITLKTPADCPAGQYTGAITIAPAGLKAATVPVTLTVWDFALTDQTHLRTMTWLPGGVIRAWYGHPWTPEGDRKQAEAMRNYEDFMLDHRLGPGGEISADDATLTRLIGRGMNAFIVGTAPNLKREKKTEYTPEFIEQFTKKLQTAGSRLREKGWLNKAYVYVYDEAPRAAWPEVKKIDRAIHAAAPELRILQCLNEPEGVKELTGFADVFDVYVAQYHKTGVAASQKKGAEVWLAVCCYPMDHPNFFLEYPLLDLRVTPWLCWKYKAGGFEYWSPASWGANWQKKGDKWPKVPWVANTFGRYNGDGHLIYPGDGLKPYSSLRFEALRDGFEDYEYLWTLASLLKQAEAAGKGGAAVDEARRLCSLDELVKENGVYATDTGKYAAYRQKLAGAIVAMKSMMRK